MQNFSSFLSRTNQQQNHIQSSIETGSERSKERGKLSIHSTISLDSSIKIHRPIAQKTKQPVFFSPSKKATNSNFERETSKLDEIFWKKTNSFRSNSLVSVWNRKKSSEPMINLSKRKNNPEKKNQRIQGLRCRSMCESFTCWFVRLEIFEVLVLKNKIGYRKPYIRCFVHLVHPHTSSIFF